MRSRNRSRVLTGFLEISPRYPKALYNKGVSLADLGRFTEAVDAYTACITMNPGIGTVLTNLGVSLANLGRFEEAVRNFDQALEIDPRDALTWHDKGLALSKSAGRMRHWHALKNSAN